MPKQEILDELEELLNIPQFERILFHRLSELKLYFEDEISYYRELKMHFKKLAYGKIRAISEETGPPREEAFFFVLDEGKDSLWQVTEIAPPLRGGCTIQDIIPPELIKILAARRTRPSGTKIQTIKNLALPAWEGMIVDLQFSEYSDTHILGIITRRSIPAHPGRNNVHENVKKNDFQKSRNYMRQYPDVKAHFLMEFYTKIKPIIGGRLQPPPLRILAAAPPQKRL